MRFLMGVLVLTFFLNLNGSSLAQEDDDEDLIRELEQILNGKQSSSDNVKENKGTSYEEEEPELEPGDFAQPGELAGGGVEEGNTNTFEGDGAGGQVPTGYGCLCKKYFECNVGGNGNNEGGSPLTNANDETPLAEMELDIRLGDTLGSQCEHYFDICCDNLRDNVTSIRNPDYKHSVCGRRNLDGVGFRITGAVNQESQFGEFPWMTAILAPEYQEGKGQLNVFVCGGSLIHPRVIMTAAHCVYKKTSQELTVRLGEWDTQTTDEVYRHKDFSVQKLIVNEEFYAGALYNDIALLILNEETELAPHIDTVCLPPTNANFVGQRCFASGWGRDSYGKEGKYQVILKKLELPVVTRDYCEYSLKRTRLGKYFRLHESFVCAGGERGNDTCRGDGGSPLVCKVPGSDSYVQYGIVAWGIGCGEEGVPGVYVNVPMFLPWITKKMAEMRLETKYFKLARTGRTGK